MTPSPPAPFQLSCVEELPAVFLCQYDLTRLSGSCLIDAQVRHPLWIIHDVVHNNPLYKHLQTNPETLDPRYGVLAELDQIASTRGRSEFFMSLTQVVRKVIPFDRAELAFFDNRNHVFRILELRNPSDQSDAPEGRTEIPAEESVSVASNRNQRAGFV